jgi:hypothetical protein
MEQSPYLLDARQLIDAFAESDAVVPPLVFAMLSIYLDEGAFEFDATRLAERLMVVNPAVRVNAEQLASLQPELERFFVADNGAWRPRPGILSYERGHSAGAHAGEIPGQSAH